MQLVQLRLTDLKDMMQQFLNLLDLFQVSVWERAHKKTLGRGEADSKKYLEGDSMNCLSIH